MMEKKGRVQSLYRVQRVQREEYKVESTAMRKWRSNLWLWEYCKYKLRSGKPENKMDKG